MIFKNWIMQVINKISLSTGRHKGNQTCSVSAFNPCNLNKAVVSLGKYFSIDRRNNFSRWHTRPSFRKYKLNYHVLKLCVLLCVTLTSYSVATLKPTRTWFKTVEVTQNSGILRICEIVTRTLFVISGNVPNVPIGPDCDNKDTKPECKHQILRYIKISRMCDVSCVRWKEAVQENPEKSNPLQQD